MDIMNKVYIIHKMQQIPDKHNIAIIISIATLLSSHLEIHYSLKLLYCFPDCPSYTVHMKSIGWTTWSIWTVIKK